MSAVSHIDAFPHFPNSGVFTEIIAGMSVFVLVIKDYGIEAMKERFIRLEGFARLPPILSTGSCVFAGTTASDSGVVVVDEMGVKYELRI